MGYPATVRIEFNRRLGDNWRDLADYLEIHHAEQRRFDRGDEPRAIWQWLEARHRLADLPAALSAIGRDDLAGLLGEAWNQADPDAGAATVGSAGPPTASRNNVAVTTGLGDRTETHLITESPQGIEPSRQSAVWVDASGGQGVIIGDNATINATFNPPIHRSTLHSDLPDLVDRLAIAVKGQWSYEATWRQLYDPYAISVRWEPADSDLVVGWSSLVRLASGGPGWPVDSRGLWAASPEGLSGAGNDLVDVLDRVPTGRLVVLGEPGAGKTILLVRLLLDLFKNRRSGQPVPILLSLASWNPERDDLYGWIEDWLTRDTPTLATSLSGGPTISKARALLDACLILPILDGLDEMPHGSMGAAIARINDAMHAGQRLILAARTDAFRSAVRPPVGPAIQLAGAAGIELRPLEAAVVTDYLRDSAGGPDAAARWGRVIEAIKADPAAPVAQALTTPLMAAMARTVYNPRPGEHLSSLDHDPAEMLERTDFPNRTAIEHHLFDAFIPAAYRPHPDRSRNGRWSTAAAMRWLAFLARDLEGRQHGTTDLAWWQLGGAAPKGLTGVFVGLVVALAGVVGIPWHGWGIGILCAILMGLAVRRRMQPRRRGLAYGLAGGILGGQVAAVVEFATFGAGQGNTYLSSFVAGGVSVGIAVAPMSSFTVGLFAAMSGELAIAFYERTPALDAVRAAVGGWASLINGVGLGLAAGIAAGLLNRRTPARGLRWSTLGFACGVGGGILFALILWATAGATIGLTCGAIAIIAGGLGGGLYEAAAPTDLTKATTPSAVLLRDRRTFLVSLALAIPFGFAITLGTALSPPDPFNGNRHGLGYGMGVGIATLLAVGFGLAFFQAMWGGFVITRCWLAASGRLPLRLMTFLNDAHINRGVLRQVGAVYQFRHAEVQRRLASRLCWPETPGESTGVVGGSKVRPTVC